MTITHSAIARAIALFLAFPGVGIGQSPSDPRTMLRDKLARDVRAVADAFPGVLGVKIIDLTDSSSVAVNADVVSATASAIKVAILVELARQADANPGLLAERHVLAAGEVVGGSGLLQYFTPGSSALSVQDLATLMLTQSDNTATNILIERVGMANVNHTLAGMGLTHTKLQREMIRPKESAAGHENISTPAEAAALMERIATCNLPVSAARCAWVLRMLELPKDETVRSVVPSRIRVASKPGSLTGIATSWAYVELPGRPFVIAVMTSWGESQRGDDAIARVARLAFEYFSRLAGATPYGTRVAPERMP